MNIQALDLVLDAARVAAILGASLAVSAMLRRRSAPLRRLVRATGLVCALVLPLAARLAPDVPGARPTIPAAFVAPFAELPSDAKPGAAPRATWSGEGGAVVSLEILRPADLLVFGWALIAAALLLRVALSHAAAAKLGRRADTAIDSGWREALAEIAKAREKRIDLRITDDLDAPAVVGVLAPIVLVPRSSCGWSASRRRAVLAHEIAHVDANDGLTRLVAQLVASIHWFDPFAWLSARGLRFDQELAADEAALRSGALPSSYASDLIEIARAARPAPAAALGMAMRSELERRIRVVISSSPGPRSSRSITVAALLTLVASATVLACTRTPVDGVDAWQSETALGSSSASAPPPAGADAKLQAIVDDEITRLVRETSAERAAVIALDPATGRVLAEAGRDHGAPADVAFGTAFSPGSPFKLVAIVEALDEKKISKASRFDCAPRVYGDETLNDASPHGSLSLAEVVSSSSNVGVSRIVDMLDEGKFLAAARRLHFGEASARIGGQAGSLPASLAPATFEAGVTALGGGVVVTSPAQIAAAYAAIAAGGVYHAPSRDGASPGERVVSAEAAAEMLDLLDGAVNAESATGAAARVDGVRVAGKTGTADFTRDGEKHIYASFVGVAPREAPRIVILVSADLAGAHAENVSGGKIAAPVFARIVQRSF